MDIQFTDALKLNRPNAFNIMLKPAGPICNLNCTYCYYLEKKKLYEGKKDFRMSDAMLEEFTKQYIKSQQVPLVTFTWQGGEPTLMGLDFFMKAMKFQDKYSGGKVIENAFQTNGTLLDDDWCKFFHDNKILVGVSIDGPEHIHDYYRKTSSGASTFKKVMKGIDLLKKHKVEFNTLSCVNDYTVRFPSETYRFLKNIGSVYLQFLPIVERKASGLPGEQLSLVTNDYSEDAQVTDWSVNGKAFGKFLVTIFDEWVRQDVGRYFVQIFDATLANCVGQMPGICVFAETCGDALVMEHNGDLYSCDHFVYPGYLLGNISKTPVIDLVKSRAQFEFGIKKRTSLPKYCLECEVLYACHGECPKQRFLKTPVGEYGLNYLCDGYKMFFHHVDPFMEYMAKELRNKRSPANVMNWIRNKDNQVITQVLPGRNDLCPCGSGRKYKNCCAL